MDTTNNFSTREHLLPSKRRHFLALLGLTLLQGGCHSLAADRTTIERRKCRLLPWSSSSSSSSSPVPALGWSLEERGPEKGSLKVTVGWGPDDNDDEEPLQVQLPTIEDPDSLASSLWPPGLAGAILCRSTLARTNFLKDKTVMELGCGLGLAGLVAAHAPAASCYLTDNDETLIAKLQQQQLEQQSTTMEAHFLDWRDESHSTDIPKPVNVVLGTDIAYYFYLLRPLMDTTREFLKPTSKNDDDGVALIVGQANRDSQWDLYHNLVDGCYNQLTDKHEEPWPGSTQMLLYRLEMSHWFDPGDYAREGTNEQDVAIDGVVPIAVLLHQTSSRESSSPDCRLTDHDYVATKADEDEMEMSF